MNDSALSVVPHSRLGGVTSPPAAGVDAANQDAYSWPRIALEPCEEVKRRLRRGAQGPGARRAFLAAGISLFTTSAIPASGTTCRPPPSAIGRTGRLVRAAARAGRAPAAYPWPLPRRTDRLDGDAAAAGRRGRLGRGESASGGRRASERRGARPGAAPHLARHQAGTDEATAAAPNRSSGAALLQGRRAAHAQSRGRRGR